MFDHERMEVYRLAVQFDILVAQIGPCRGHRSLKDQIDRASVSIMACIAEGAGRRSPPDKRRFYGMARASATECAVHLDAMKNRRLVTDDLVHNGRRLLLSIVRMLSRLSAPPTFPELEPAPDPSPIPLARID